MICIFVDALNQKYLKYMPYLNSLLKSNLHGSLEPPLGYTDIIASFMNGMHPYKNKLFDLFIPRTKPKNTVGNTYLTALIRLLQNKRVFFTPLKTNRKYFKPALDKTWPQKNCLPYPTIFDILEKNNRSFISIDFPNYFKNRKGKIFFSKEKTLQLAKKSRADFTFVHFLDLEIAHKYGTNSAKTISTAIALDKKLSQLDQKDMLIFSDHSMDDIKKEINIQEEIEKLNLTYGEDLIYIIGSTTLEFWFKSPTAEKKILNLIKKYKELKIISPKHYKIPKTSDLLILAELGTAFHPNFFSKQRFKAMHGWAPKQQKTLYIIKNHKGNKDAEMIDLFPTILNLMHLPKPECDGESLF